MAQFKNIANKRIFNDSASKNRHRKLGDDGEYDDPDESKPRTTPNNQKLVFDEDGNVSSNVPKAGRTSTVQQHQQQRGGVDVDTKWYQLYSMHNKHGELDEMKEAEIVELTKLCRTCFESELAGLQKQNPSDAKWLQTALHKGTSKDRANAGALLVQSNPLANLSALETLITLAKVSNKTSAGAVDIITELFISALLPPSRKLLGLALRGADWKTLRKDPDVAAEKRDRILAYWHFEHELKEHYFEFLRNVQAAIQGNQEVQKNQAIICSARLLTFSPEKEQMLLSMLVNKLGDPSNKVASKALHHLSDVAHRHPAMCEVIAQETEKLLFRNNITEHAQHFALCFLSSVAPRGNAAVCTRLVQICFSFFKVVVQKGAVNSRTMQAILRCLKSSIVDAAGSATELLTKEIQDTMYRLVHLADVHIALQTLALLLQVMSVRSGNYDRFYNALYRKMLDINLVDVGPKAAAQFLHIVHRAIHMDANVSRAQAFVKRLLQVAFYFPAQITCGCLIVVNKLIRMRPELGRTRERPQINDDPMIIASEIASGSDQQLESVDVPTDEQSTARSTNHPSASKYNPFHRNAAYAGAEYALRTELLQLARHFHPTVQVFAQNLIAAKPINFYGDPLRDFCLTQFLERFSFRNPKKLTGDQPPLASESAPQHQHGKHYKAFGGRGQPVQNLTRTNCTEDERFIFQYLEQKREKRMAIRKALGKKSAAGDGSDSDGSVDDDEFDAYLDGLGGGGCGKADADEEFDFMGALSDNLRADDAENTDTGKQSKRAQKRAAENDEIAEGDWDEDGDDDEEDDGKHGVEKETDGFSSDEDGSISLDDEEDGSDMFEGSSEEDSEDPELLHDDDGDSGSAVKKSKRSNLSDRAFEKKLKSTSDMSSMFAAVDDFSEMLQDTSKSKTHGTLGELFNQDRSSEKQLAWEQKRMKLMSGKGRNGGSHRFAKNDHNVSKNRKRVGSVDTKKKRK